MESGLLLREKEIVKEKRIPLILLVKGNIPKDFPKDKILEYYNLKIKLEKGEEINKLEFEKLNEEIKRWNRNEFNDPSYFMLLNIAEKINSTGKYLAEIAFEEFCYPDITEAILSLTLRGHKFIIVIPMDYLNGLSQETYNKIEELKTKLNVEIVIAWPYSLNLLLDFIREHLSTFIGR